jgi:ADP-ribose pyrophosphatase YjhB (NUDIX family)
MSFTEPPLFKEPRVGCGAAIVRDGKILLMQRLRAPEAGCWGLAGGKIDLYETAPQACEREIAEELGLVIRADTLLCFVDQIDREAGTHWVSPVYLVTDFAGEPVNREPVKCGGIGWFALGDLPAPLTRAAVVALEALAQRP